MEYIKLREVISSAKTERCGASDYPVLSITKSDGVVLQSDKFKKRIASTDTEQYKLVKRGQLVQGIHIDEANFGIQSIVDIGIVSPAYKIWNVDFQKIVPKYLETVLRSPRSVRYYSSKFNGSVKRRERIADNDFLAMEIPFPSKEQQQYAVDVLEKASNMTTLYQQQLQKLDELVKARFVELFGDPISNSYNLSEAMLSELGEFGRGVSKHRPRNDPKLLGGKYPLIQTGDVAAADLYISSYTSTYSELGLSQSKMWGKGTLCITIAANIAKTAILDFDACFPDSVVGFTANARTSNIFIHYWFSFFQEILESQAPESAQKNINLKILSELKVIVPPKEGQDAFVNFVEQVIKSKAVIRKALDETKLLFDSLMQEYFG